MSFWELMFIVFVGIPLVVLWAGAIIDLFRRQDLHWGAITLWVIAMVAFPFVGVIAYLATRPRVVDLRGGTTSSPEETERYVATQDALLHDTPGGLPPTTIPPRSR